MTDEQQNEPEPDVEPEPEHAPGTAPPEPDAEPNAEPDAEPEPDVEPEPEPEALSEKQLEKAFAKMETEAKRHRTRLAEIMGEEALLLEPCPLCSPQMAGWRFQVVPSEDEWREVEAAVFGGTTAERPTADYVSACDACEALGEVATGSKVPGRSTIPCRKCQGAGYLTRDTPMSPPTAASPSEANGDGFQAPGEALPERDFMGRTRDDLNFGVLAGYEK